MKFPTFFAYIVSRKIIAKEDAFMCVNIKGTPQTVVDNVMISFEQFVQN